MTVQFLPAVKSLQEGIHLIILRNAANIDHYVFRQQTLDGNLVPRVPPFTKLGLTDYIVELIVTEDEVSFSSMFSQSHLQISVDI